jgi:hypothetical protein
LLFNPYYSFHYLGFKGISLDNEMVPIPSFNWDSDDNRGVIMDSGTVLTRIPRNAYNIFGNGLEHWSRCDADTWPKLDTCHACNGSSALEHWRQAGSNIFIKTFLDFTTNDMIQAEPPKNLEDCTCFSTLPQSNSVPEVKFHFTSTSSLTLTTLQVYMFTTYTNPIGEETKLLVCIGFIPTDSGFTILGSKQLQGTRQTYDLINMKLKLTPGDCY